MNEGKKYYGGIELTRLISAFLIVAIHTSPLLSVNGTADFILTRVIARIAVPFFFMTSGFFLLSKHRMRVSNLRSYTKKMAILYGVGILLYLPINLYAGYFKMKNLFPNVIKDLVFDGTFYHLWYLPAAICGALISFILVKKLGFGKAFTLTLILYVIGLFGDSYYGLAEQAAPVKAFYQGIFYLSDYTRNGLFFAPVFFLLGGICARSHDNIPSKYSLPGAGISILLLLTEGLLLHYLKYQRHDSMYLMLIPLMFFLFHTILCWNVSVSKRLRDISLIIYLIHPMLIILLRGVAKVIKMQELLIQNSLIHYIFTALFSIIVALILDQFIERRGLFRLKNTTCSIIAGLPVHTSVPSTSVIDFSPANCRMDRAWIEIQTENLRHNVTALRENMAEGCEFMAIVKADAYGHGAKEVSRLLNEMGIHSFGVATINEGILLRKQGIKGDILILGYTSPERCHELTEYQLIQTIIDYDYAVALNSFENKLQVHIKIDTGMHRIGIPAKDVDKIEELFHFDHLEICGMFTHLSVSDSEKEEDVLFTLSQIGAFYDLIDLLKKRSVPIPKLHVQSSYGLLNYPELHCDYVRIGISLYGAESTWGDHTKIKPNLLPVLSLKARVALIREIAKGEGVSYGRTFKAGRDSKLALLPIGYADGLPRSLSCENGSVLIHGCRVPIIGRICMDQLIVDVTDIPGVKSGDIATLIGKDGKDEILASEVAKESGSITNELFSRLGSRLERVYL